MAFELHGETVVSSSSPSKTTDRVAKFDSEKETHNKLLLSNPLPAIDIDYLLTQKTITDLPPALVSEILHYLDAKELGVVSCVSTLLHKVASDHQGWKNFYFEKWGSPHLGITMEEMTSWKELFVERILRSQIFMGRFNMDVLYGHTEAVRAVFLLTAAKVVVSAGYDMVIRLWDMEDGLLIASSVPLGCTIRAVAADNQLLVVGGSDGFLHCWKVIEGLSCLFDVAGLREQNSEFRLWEHQGPVTCIALDSSWVYSGSWDMTIRIWDRVSYKCSKVLMHKEWIWSLAPAGSNVASTAGGDVYVWDVESGDLLTAIQSAHEGTTYSLARSRMGDLLFTGGADGKIHMYEITDRRAVDFAILHVATWVPHTGAVSSLAFEFPWLVSAAADGKISLIDVRKLLKSRKRLNSRGNLLTSPSMEAPQRMLNGFGHLFSLDIGADRIVCAGEERVVRIWNFSQAFEIQQRVQALRGIRLENRMRRRKVQLEMNTKADPCKKTTKGGRADQCSVAAKKKQINGDRNGGWHGRRTVSGKVKT